MQDYSNERWVVVEGLGKYEISDCGRIRSVSREYQPGKFTGIILKQGFTHDGYLRASLHLDDGSKKPFTIHRLVALGFVSGKSSLNKEVNHLDGDKLNNHYTNLEWTTCKNNQIHAHRTGLKQYNGQGNPNNKLSVEKILEIKSLIGKVSYNKLVVLYGISKTQIGRIAHNETWKHLWS